MGLGDMLKAVQDAEDAERYRHLRDHTGNVLMRKLMKECRPDGWDRLIDQDRRVTDSTAGHE